VQRGSVQSICRGPTVNECLQGIGEPGRTGTFGGQGARVKRTENPYSKIGENLEVGDWVLGRRAWHKKQKGTGTELRSGFFLGRGNEGPEVGQKDRGGFCMSPPKRVGGLISLKGRMGPNSMINNIWRRDARGVTRQGGTVSSL